MLTISRRIRIPDREIELPAVRAQGAGGQNVNKVASAIHLRFDIHASSLPQTCKEKLLAYSDRRISSDGVVVIKAQRFRSQDKNREDARTRLQALIRRAIRPRAVRKPTRVSRAAKRKRVDNKTRHGRTKAMRGPPGHDD